MLAHYMKDEDYTNEIINGDIHTANQRLAGLESRNQAKTFIYALLYGAGDEKLGTVVGRGREAGKQLRESFLNNLPSFADLKGRVSEAAGRGYLIGLDGRKLGVRSEHSALNTLLQSAGSLVMKKALTLLDDYGKIWGIDYKFVGNIHDEIQAEVVDDEDFVDEIIKEIKEKYPEASDDEISSLINLGDSSGGTSGMPDRVLSAIKGRCRCFLSSIIV